MQAIIFNSGTGSRMGSLTENCPKGLLKVGGESIFYRQLRILSCFGIKEFIVTTGKYEQVFKSEAKKVPGISVRFVNNPLYMSTNYIYSFHLAGNFIKDKLIMLHGDLYFSEKAAKEIINSPYPDACLISRIAPLPAKDFKARLRGNIISEISVTLRSEELFPGQTAAALQPFYKLSQGLAQMWLCKTCEFVNEGKVNVYAENALNEILPQIQLCGTDCGNEYVTEIDTPEDYEEALKYVKGK